MRVSKQANRSKLIKRYGFVIERAEEKSARISMPRGGGRGADDDDGDPISYLIIKKPKKSGRKQTSRKTRTKTRKPKYLSLRRQFSASERSPESSEMPSSTISTTTSCTASRKNSGSKQLNLFPLHPENLVEEKEAHDENMAYLFSVADGGASTLTGLLESATNTSSSDHGEDVNKSNNDSSGTTTLSPSASLMYTFARGGREDQEEVALARTALRNKERAPSEERWVRYSEVVERRDDQEVCSCAAPDMRWRSQRLSLKLDYEEILSAWSDKGSLFIHAHAAAPPQSPQTVPDSHDDFLASSQITNEMISRRPGWGNNRGCNWRVPELPVSQGSDQHADRLPSVKGIKTEEEQEEVAVRVVGGAEYQWKMMGQREARVNRYKEKRRNRLFSKRIRYQVRKINAEKRPRLKGRFVKRS